MAPPSDPAAPAEAGAPRGHYPYQAAVDAYGNGGFRFAGMSHRGSLLCLPTGMDAWRIAGVDELRLEAFAPVLDIADRIEVLFIGMGDRFLPLASGIREAFRDRGVIVEPTSTRNAVSTYNVLFAEQRPVAAALIAVERTR